MQDSSIEYLPDSMISAEPPQEAQNIMNLWQLSIPENNQEIFRASTFTMSLQLLTEGGVVWWPIIEAQY